MTRKNKYGHYVIAAGEVAEYALCPESWRLGIVERKRRDTNEDVEEGIKLHDSWADDFLSVTVLRRMLRTLFLMLALACALMIARALI